MQLSLYATEQSVGVKKQENIGDYYTEFSKIPRESYAIIYADPPWRYKGGKGKNSKKFGNSLASYSCMKIEDMRKIPVRSIACDDSALFMWATWPMIKEAIDLMESWGFSYKTCAFVWNKTYKNGKPYCGLGYYTRSGSEFCLLGTTGKVSRESNCVYQVVTSPVERHSEKPSIVRSHICDLMGTALKKIELFSRKGAVGWDAFGNDPGCI